jgi:hypothetical protein
MGEFCWNLAFADLQHCGERNKLGFVLVSVMLAEEKFGTRRQLGAYASCGTAAIAAVSSSQLGTCQSCVHWLLLLVYPLSQTFGVFALFPDRYQVCRFSRICHTFRAGALR